MDEPLPNPPAELKAVLPFVQRANELRTADKVIAYWCCYYAAQLGISGNALETEAKMYLLTLMDTLEDLKAKLADNDAVTNDAASSAYVENFALKVFVGADNEDRAGKATRATAKKFLAAGQFIELLKIFGTLEPEMQEKIKYSKWKAADIAKAFKEGRTPQPGPAGGDPKLEAASLEAAMAPSEVDSKEEQEYLAREMAKLTSSAPDQAPTLPYSTSVHRAETQPSSHLPPSSNAAMSRGSSSGSHAAVRAPSDGASPDADEMWKSSSKPTKAMSRSSSAHWESLDCPQVQPSSSFNSGLGSSPGSRPLPVPPQWDGVSIPPLSAHQQLSGSSPGLDAATGPGAAPASFWGAASGPTSDHEHVSPDGSVLPSVPLDHPPTFGGLYDHPAIERIDPPLSPSAPSLPSTPGQLPGSSGVHSRAFIPHVPTGGSLAATHVHPPPSAPGIPAVAYPESLDAKLSTRVQKLAKGAASAVDFEDLDTARIQLRQALDILEGRTTA